MTAPLADQLHDMTADELTQFFAARPDLAEPPPADVRSLAERANAPYQIEQVVRRLDGLGMQLVHALAWFDGRGSDHGLGAPDAPGGWTSVARIEALAAEAPPPGAVATGLARLRRLGIAGTRADGRWALVAPIAEGGLVRPFGLGPQLDKRLQRYSLPELQVMARNLGLDEKGLKGALVDRIAAHLSTQPGVADAVGRGAPGSAELLMMIDSIGGTLGDLGGAITREGMGELRALVSLGLLVPFGGGGFIIPAEVQLVMRRGFPLEEWAVAPADPTRLDEPDGTDPHSGPGRFDSLNIFDDLDDGDNDDDDGLSGEVRPGRASRGGRGGRGGRAGRDSDADAPWSRLVSLAPGGAADIVARIGLRWRDAAAPALKTGGLGVKELRALATQIGVDERSTARLVELGALAGLLGMRVDQPAQLIIPQGRRKPVLATPVEVLGPTKAFTAWVLGDPAARWWSLVRTWWSTPWDASRAGRPYGDAAKPIAAMSWAWEKPGDLPAIRRRVFEALMALDPGTPIERSSLLAHVLWFDHEPFADRDIDPLETVVDVLREAALLGLIADDGTDNLTPAGRVVAAALLNPKVAKTFDPASLVHGALETFTVQADLTAIAPAELDVAVRTELGLLADVESTGAATVLRFGETSMRRALDAGRDAAAIHAFLTQHARPAVPQSLTYLVDDVARRHGGLRVGTCTSYVRCDDAALLAQVVRHKKAAKAGFDLIAPTVAVSALPSAKVVQMIRDAGFLPVEEGAGGVVLRQGSARAERGLVLASQASQPRVAGHDDADPLPHVEPSMLRRFYDQRHRPIPDEARIASLVDRLVRMRGSTHAR